MKTIKNAAVAASWLMFAVILCVILTMGMLTADGSVEGFNLISPLTVGTVVTMIMICEAVATFGRAESWFYLLFHTLVFAGVVGIAYSCGMLDGYTSWQRGMTYYGTYDEIETAISASEWYVFYGGYALRVLLQVISTVRCIFGKRAKDEEKEPNGKIKLSFAGAALALWFVLGFYSLLIVGPKPQRGGYYRDNFDSFSIEELSNCPKVGAAAVAFQPIQWLVEPQTDSNFGWINFVAMLIGFVILAALIKAWSLKIWWTELLSALMLLYLWGYVFINIACLYAKLI